MAEQMSEEELSLLANFVFKGTVQKLKAASMPEVPVTARTAVVRVDEIIEAPPTMTDFTGRDITVELGGKKKIKAGGQALFYANGWILGDGLAVRSIEHRAVPPVAGMAAVGVTPGDPVENLANKHVRARFERSSVVISGRVKAVRLPEATEGRAAAAAASAAGPGADSVAPEVRPVSEHDPVMHEAVVEVEAVHKGEHAGSETFIRFPSSTDVQWYRSPKFRPGQQGYFMLQREGKGDTEAAAKGPVAAAAMAPSLADEVPGGTYTALHPADFQPIDRPGGVRNLIPDVPAPVDAADD
jgi:hypothetical protein